MKYTNQLGISLPVAVWLTVDDYDYINEPNTISVTTLIRPIRQVVLGRRAPKKPTDISSLIPSRMGQAMHKAIEMAWLHNHSEALKALGYSDDVVEAVRINPEVEEPGTIPVYLEQRASKHIDGMIVTGKFDLIVEGRLTDVKSCSVFAYINKSNEPKWKLQGSIYRWLNPEKVRDANLTVEYLFTDWSAYAARSDLAYPQRRAVSVPIELLSLSETESYLRERIALIRSLMNAPEEDIPECTDEDLWRDAPVFKYYANPDKRERSTKNFDNLAEAEEYKNSKGKGIVIAFPGMVKACKYCPAFDVCSQKDRYLTDGLLKLD